MWEKIYESPIEEATVEELWVQCHQPDDGYVEHALIMDALCELIRRGIVEDFPKKPLDKHPDL